MIVVDANIMAYRLIEGDKTALAREAQRRDAHWVVPTLCRHELLNVLASATRQGILAARNSAEIWAGMEPLLTTIEQPVDMAAALALSIRDGISAYDAQYIALARALKVSLLTEDKRLLRAYPALACSLKDFCSRDRGR